MIIFITWTIHDSLNADLSLVRMSSIYKDNELEVWQVPVTRGDCGNMEDPSRHLYYPPEVYII